MQTFDLEALIRACLIGLSVAIIGRYIVHLVTKGKTPEKESKRLLTMAAVATFILVAMGTYYGWPSLPTVPILDKLSQAEAEKLLINNKLVPQPRPQMSTEVTTGLVIPHSQEPAAGIRVNPGTFVSFGVSTQAAGANTQTAPKDGGVPEGLSVRLFQPKSGEALRCAAGGDGIYHCAVRGVSSGVQIGGFHVLLWLKPVSPPSDRFGWYLQRSGNGVERINNDGSWTGILQIGNAQYPPHQNDTIDLAASVVDDGAFHELMARGGVIVESEPVGFRIDIASNITINLH